jgi:hypothetical protein
MNIHNESLITYPIQYEKNRVRERQQSRGDGRRSASSRYWKESEIHWNLEEGESNQRMTKKSSSCF